MVGTRLECADDRRVGIGSGVVQLDDQVVEVGLEIEVEENRIAIDRSAVLVDSIERQSGKADICPCRRK